MKILSAKEMNEVDQRASSEYGIPSLLLMENAGIRSVEIIEEILEQSNDKHIVVVAGRGNNGGDGLVVARHMINASAYVECFVMCKEEEMTEDSRLNYQILKKMGAKIYPLLEEADLDKLLLSVSLADLIVDAMYGIGFNGAMNDFDSKIVKILNWANKALISLDIPSGIEADTGKVHGEAVKATHTITFALPKLGLLVEPGKNYTGDLSVADISIPKALMEDNKYNLNLITEKHINKYIKPRQSESHKGSYGHALIIGGSLGLSGAVLLTAYAALRSGVGLVTAAVPESLVPVVETAIMELMTVSLNETSEASIALEALPAIENLLGTASVCAIGPGMSRYSEANAILRFVLERSGIPVVIDADGLNALQGDTSILKNRQIPIVLTPHPGEMARLTGKSIEEIQSRRIEIAREAALEWGVTIVLKGNKTIVATPSGEIYLNIKGNPGMATAGSGDVLCGIITALIGQGIKPQDAAILGVYLHALAGDQAKAIKGERGMVASDLIETLSDILKHYEEN